jgi:hypothetical protein
MRVTAILVLATLTALPAASAEPQAALTKIVDDAQHGHIELCRDPRWPSWRFEEGEAGRARLSTLKRLTDAAWTARRNDTRGDPFAAAQESNRLYALSSVIGAAIAAADKAEWTAAFDNAAQFMGIWRVKALAVVGDGFTAKLARRNVWRLADARTSGRQPPSQVFKVSAYVSRRRTAPPPNMQFSVRPSPCSTKVAGRRMRATARVRKPRQWPSSARRRVTATSGRTGNASQQMRPAAASPPARWRSGASLSGATPRPLQPCLSFLRDSSANGRASPHC